MRASQDRLRRWALPGDDSRRTLWIRRLRNVDSDTSSERPAWRLAAGERRCRGKGRCRTVSPTASVQLPHRAIPASSACHGDPGSPAGGGRPPGRRLAPRDLREWGFVAFATGGSSCSGHRRPVRRRQLHCFDGHEGRVSAVTVSLAGTVISEVAMGARSLGSGQRQAATGAPLRRAGRRGRRHACVRQLSTAAGREEQVRLHPQVTSSIAKQQLAERDRRAGR